MKSIILTLIVSTALFIIGCGGSSKESSSELEQATRKTDAEKELVLTMELGENDISFVDVIIRNDAMTPADDTNKYTIYAGLDDEEEEGIRFALTFDQDDSELGESTWMDFKGYLVESVDVDLEYLETRITTMRAKVVTSLKGSFRGQLKELDERGFATGDPIDFKGTFEK